MATALALELTNDLAGAHELVTFLEKFAGRKLAQVQIERQIKEME
jgi:hypothetical protein